MRSDGPRLVASWRVSSTAEHTADELHVLWDGLFHTHELSMRSVSGACIASVVPSLTPIYTALMRERLRIPAVVVGPDIDLGVGLDVENPQEPGADRLANALAAYEEGVRSFDSSLGGLGGCPFAPGASGNVITEDLVFMFEAMGVSTGIDLDKLMAARRLMVEVLPQEQTYGHFALAGIPKGFRAAA